MTIQQIDHTLTGCGECDSCLAGHGAVYCTAMTAARMLPEVLDKKQMAALFGVSTSSIDKWVAHDRARTKEKKLPKPLHKKGKLLWSRKNVETWLAMER